MRPRFTKSLAFRLTSLYSALFSFAFVLVFVTIYSVVGKAIFKNTDDDLLEDVAEIREAYEKGGLSGLKEYIRAETEDDGPENLLLRIIGPDGAIIYSSDTSRWGEVSVLEKTGLTEEGPDFVNFTIPKRPQIKARSIIFRVKKYMVQEAVPLEWNLMLLGKLRQAIFVGAIMSILIAISSGWIMTKQALAKVKEMNEVARRIAWSNDLSQRVPLSGAGDEIDRLAATFNAMLDRLETFIRELSDMMDNTAHDFKTPLARIRAMAETSLQSQDLNAVHEAMVQIMDESDRFLSLLNAIMDISEARTGLISLKKEEVLVKDLLDEIASLFSVVSQAKGIKFNNVSHHDGEEKLFVDKRRILQALLNVLDNAFKFTPRGGTVALWYEKEDGWIAFHVYDTGPGIPEKEFNRIFERFYRHDNSRSSPGRGIGLSLASAYVEAHGGNISVKSILNSGSTFSIRLPIHTQL